MAIIVEDGTGKTDSNSYVSEAEFTTYANNRGLSNTGSISTLLFTSMDYIEQQCFKGLKNTQDQALQWPRSSAWLDGFLLPNDEIPTLLKEAQIEVALGVDAGNNPLETQDRATKKEKVDVIEVEYMDGARDTTYLAAAEAKLSKLLAFGARGLSAVAIRG
jgi:hypothetical protein